MRQGGDRAMPSTPSPIRLAFVAALAAFALGACSGGGGGTPATGGASNPFPTTTGKEIAQGCCLQDGNPVYPTQSLPAGLKLADFQALPGVPYSEFALTGRPDKTVAGIPVHIDTSDSVTDEDGKTYSAVAYRSVLEHGEMLLATRLDSSAPAASTASAGTSNTGRSAVHQNILFGTPTPASADISEVSGTWSGIAIGREEHEGDVPASVDHASDMVVEGEVGIAMSTGGGNARINVDFTDWEGYPDAAFRNVEVTQEGNSYGFDLGSPEGSDWAWAAGQGSFYGDQFQEIMGTGGFQTATGGRTLHVVYGAKKQAGDAPATSPPAPTLPSTSKFFPINTESGQVTRITRTLWNTVPGYQAADFEFPAGSTLETLVDEGYTRLNIPQFSEFEFGQPVDTNGIPLQKDTATVADRYAAVAYQAVLEHSMLLLQGGVYNTGVAGFPNRDVLVLSTGFPSPLSPSVAGTWKGKAVGFEEPRGWMDNNAPQVPITSEEAEKHIVQADVEIGVALDGGDQNVTWAFRNWEGGRVEYPDVTSEGVPLLSRNSTNVNVNFSKRDLDSTTWTVQGVGIRFYGPARQEAGGIFNFEWNNARSLRGGFAAKKQP